MAIAPRVPIALRVPIGLRVSIGLRNAIGVREHLLRRLSACHPVGDFIEVESPYATDLETRQAAVFQQTVNRYSMDT